MVPSPQFVNICHAQIPKPRRKIPATRTKAMWKAFKPTLQIPTESASLNNGTNINTTKINAVMISTQ